MIGLNKFQLLLFVTLIVSFTSVRSNNLQLPDNPAPWLQELINQPQYKDQINRFGFAVGGQIRIKLESHLAETIEMPQQLKETSRLLDYDQYLGGQYITGEYNLKNVAGLQLFLPFGIFEGVQSGQLFVEGSLVMLNQGRALAFKDLRIAHAKRPPKAGDMAVLDITDGNGHALFHLDNIHTVWEQNNNVLRYQHVDMRLSSWLAEQLNKSHLSGRVVGSLQMINNVTQNDLNATVKGGPPQCNSRPVWPSAQDPADVMLIELTGESRQVDGGGTDRIVIPKARLQNIGDADVPWYRKFTGSFPPHNNNQHPYLIWNLYQEKEGRFTQVAASALKHAFYTTNQQCTLNCYDNNILWPGCRDTYGQLSNDNNLHLGPRQEINPFLGTWDSCGSFFDPGCTGSQTNAASNDGQRMRVKLNEINDAQANYYLSAWYVVRDDIDIYNSMGSRPVAYSATSKYLTNTGPFEQGPAADRWVANNGFDPSGYASSFRLLRPGAGHLSVKTKVIDIGGGLYRYHYFVENYDYNPGLSGLEIPLQSGTTVSQYDFTDVDDIGLNDWPLNNTGTSLEMASSNDHYITWGYGFTFSVTLSQTPIQGSVRLTGEQGEGDFWIPALVPLTDLIFADGF